MNTQNCGRKVVALTPEAIKDSEAAKKRKWISIANLVVVITTLCLLITGLVLFYAGMPVFSALCLLVACNCLMIDNILNDQFYESLLNEKAELGQKKLDQQNHIIEQLKQKHDLLEKSSQLKDSLHKVSKEINGHLVHRIQLIKEFLLINDCVANPLSSQPIFKKFFEGV